MKLNNDELANHKNLLKLTENLSDMLRTKFYTSLLHVLPNSDCILNLPTTDFSNMLYNEVFRVLCLVSKNNNIENLVRDVHHKLVLEEQLNNPMQNQELDFNSYKQAQAQAHAHAHAHEHAHAHAHEQVQEHPGASLQGFNPMDFLSQLASMSPDMNDENNEESNSEDSDDSKDSKDSKDSVDSIASLDSKNSDDAGPKVENDDKKIIEL